MGHRHLTAPCPGVYMAPFSLLVVTLPQITVSRCNVVGSINHPLYSNSHDRMELNAMATYLTGDTHGNFLRVDTFCRAMETTKSDTMIILGDAGFNYSLNDRDTRAKEYASAIPVKFFCIHGNHEARPQRIPSYIEGEYCGGKILYEEAFPNILFAVDGEVYNFDGYKCIVIGGAYSVDKHYRLAHGWHWWPDEQPDEEIKAVVEARLAALHWNIDIVLTHTCPRKYEPTEVFLSGLDQSSVDKSTEDWLDGIEDRLNYKKWYCGHYHTRKQIGKIQFMFEDFDTIFIRL